MAEKPFFSVIVPVYNKGPYVARAINSILAQTFADFELIIVCDPSSDNSNEEVDKFSDPRIRIFHRDKPGPGGYAARNLGIKNSQADWVAFLDADDEWYPMHLEKMQKAIQDNPQIEIFSAGWKYSRPNKKDKVDKYFRKNHGNRYQLYTLDNYMLGPRPINTNVIVLKKELILKVKGFDESWKHGADQQFWFKCLYWSKNPGCWIDYISAKYYLGIPGQVVSNLAQTRSPTAEYIKKLNNQKIYTNNRLQKFANKESNAAFFRYAFDKNYSQSIGNLKQLMIYRELPIMSILTYRLYSILSNKYKKKYLRVFRKTTEIILNIKFKLS